jgi:type I restriction enzyme M protein
VGEEEIDLEATNAALVAIEKDIQKALTTHNEFLKELGLPVLPSAV